jgi:hypothetical protein
MHRYRLLLLPLAIVVCWMLVLPLSWLFARDAISEPTITFYNIFNVLVSAMAFAGLVMTLWLQREESKRSNLDNVERSIFELFTTFTSDSFQKVKDDAFLCLLLSVKNKAYAEYLASRLFPIGRRPYPTDIEPILFSLRPELRKMSTETLITVDRNARLKLDNILNFFAMLAHRQAAHSVIKHVDFAYDWWRPTLWIIAQLQYEMKSESAEIAKWCRNPMLHVTLETLDRIYAFEPIQPGEQVYAYLKSHPWLREQDIDSDFFARH